MKHLDLFSGIGGFALAARWAGMETVALCEIDKFCHKVLRNNFPGVPIHDDIRTLRGEDYAGIDIITGGYPCQPFSTAGKRKGEADPRHLWPEMFRIIRESRPTWVVCENVEGHIANGLDAVCDDLEREGYTCWPIVIPACAVEAPHIRKRVWIIANGSGTTGKRDSRAIYSTEEKRHSTREQNGAINIRLADESSEHRARNERSWIPEPRLARLVHGLPNRVDRCKSLGNAIVPQVAYEILRCIRAV